MLEIHIFIFLLFKSRSADFKIFCFFQKDENYVIIVIVIILIVLNKITY